MAEWMLTDKELMEIWQVVTPGQSHGAHNEGRRAAKAQARKLVEYLEKHLIAEVDYGKGPPWRGLWILRPQWKRLKKEVGDGSP